VLCLSLRFFIPVLQMLRFLLLCVISLVLCAYALSARAQTPTPVPVYTDVTVFFELYADTYSDSVNLALFRDDKVRLVPLGVERVDNFDWKTHTRDDLSWWMRIEDLRYLLPAIDSGSEDHTRFVRDWFNGWYEIHEQDSLPNRGAWQPMTAGIRALVLVRLLRDLHDSGRQDAALEMRLRESIIEHQWFLEREENFESRSNHGIWEALGLFETARVNGETGMAAFALRRLADLVDASVSDKGVHKEHSAAYHLYFSRWLSELARYFELLGMESWSDVETLEMASEKMRNVSYYLVDHQGNVPQIGDTDARRIEPDSLGASERDRDPVLFDEDAGIAVFKDPLDANLGRYVVFNTRQLRNLTLSLAHTHRDVLAVYFSCDGEIVFGDGGRFEYRDSIERRFFRSSAAHNTVIPEDYLDSTTRVSGPIGGAAPTLSSDAGSVVFEGNLNNQFAIRRVTIPLEETGFVVDDWISPGFNVILLWNTGRDINDVSPETVVERDGSAVHSWVLTTRNGRRFTLELTVPAMTGTADESRIEVLRGQKDPMLGWHSIAYRQKEPVTVFKLTLRSANGAAIRTRIIRH
jgi:hypothetical protein